MIVQTQELSYSQKYVKSIFLSILYFDIQDNEKAVRTLRISKFRPYYHRGFLASSSHGNPLLFKKF